MTEKDIIKALMCLTKDNSSCDDRLHCYFLFKEPSCFNCYHEVAKNALALINRQKSEIADLRETNKHLSNECNRQKAEVKKLKADNKKMFDKWEILDNATKKYYADLYTDSIKVERAEAIKEFAEMLKKCLHTDDFKTPDERWKPESEFALMIDYVVKEMREGE